MLERRNFLFAEGGADRDRAVAGGGQHPAAALCAGLSAASAGGDGPAILQLSGRLRLPASRKLHKGFSDVDSLTRTGTKSRSGHFRARISGFWIDIHFARTVFVVICAMPIRVESRKRIVPDIAVKIQ